MTFTIDDIYTEIMSRPISMQRSMPRTSGSPRTGSLGSTTTHHVVNSGVEFMLLYEDYIQSLIDHGATITATHPQWFSTDIHLLTVMGTHFDLIHKFSVNTDRILHMVNLTVSPKLAQHQPKIQIIRDLLKEHKYSEGSHKGKFVKIIDGIYRVTLLPIIIP